MRPMVFTKFDYTQEGAMHSIPQNINNSDGTTNLLTTNDLENIRRPFNKEATLKREEWKGLEEFGE